SLPTRRSSDLRGFTTEFTVHTASGEPIDGQVAAPGRHNVLNAVAAVVVADELGHDLEVAVEGVADFAGAARRFELKGEGGGVGVYDSYAHQPTEVEAELRATRAAMESFGEETADMAHGRLIYMYLPTLDVS